MMVRPLCNNSELEPFNFCFKASFAGMRLGYYGSPEQVELWMSA
jgi:hypothetical protein